MTVTEGQKPGEVVTFYSYKGGTGRTMALANVACLLAERARPEGGRVLVVDWDLEAPGLHRFFPHALQATDGSVDLDLDATPGLIDYFGELSERMPAEPPPGEDEAEEAVARAIGATPVRRYVAETAVDGVFIMRAGRNDDGLYARRVNTFRWDDLYRRGPSVYRAFAEAAAKDFAYVLVDSRTGETDISGICTSLIPSKVVVVFTPNRQSITGVSGLVSRATADRKRSDDLRTLLVFPLPSRIEASLHNLRATWRFGNRDKSIVGYQPMFEGVFARCYGLPACDLGPYFDTVQIQQTPDYAYGEEIAVRRQDDRLSLGESYRIFVERLVSGKPPWTVPEAAKPAAATPLAANAEVHPPSADPAAGLPRTSPTMTATAVVAAGTLTVTPPRGIRVYLSYSAQDRQQGRAIQASLERAGCVVFAPTDATAEAQAGASLQQELTKALDRSDVVVVCWSTASISSQWVLAEAAEGLRRGVLVPVLLDDAPVPLGFRSIQAADLRRDGGGGIDRLIAGVSRAAASVPGTPPALSPPSAAAQPRSAISRGLPFLLPALVILAVWWVLRAPRAHVRADDDDGVLAGHGRAPILVPDFSGSSIEVARSAATGLGLEVGVVAADGGTLAADGGLVVTQEPVAGHAVPTGERVTLMVAAPPAATAPDATQAARLARAVTNMIETGTADQNLFLLWMTTGVSKLATDGSSYFILHRYVLESGPRIQDVQPYLDRAERKDPSLATDRELQTLLVGMARDPLVVQIAKTYLDDGWWRPTVERAAQLGITLSLGLAALYDARLKAIAHENTLIAATSAAIDAGTPINSGELQRTWIRAFVQRMPEPSRTEFQKLVKDDNWDLTKQIVIRGQPLIVDWAPKNP
jgi:cellulose biosynthesis protein BcsQ